MTLTKLILCFLALYALMFLVLWITRRIRIFQYNQDMIFIEGAIKHFKVTSYNEHYIKCAFAEVFYNDQDFARTERARKAFEDKFGVVSWEMQEAV